MTDRDRYEKEHAKPGQFFPDERKSELVPVLSECQLDCLNAFIANSAKLVAAAREVLRCYHPGRIGPSQMAPGLKCNAALDALSVAVSAIDPNPPAKPVPR